MFICWIIWADVSVTQLFVGLLNVRMLTVEEKERLQKEEKLNKAGKKISLAAEELNTNRWERIFDTCKDFFFFIFGMQSQQRKRPVRWTGNVI